MSKIKTIIMGAAGRDFHTFNVYFRNNPAYEVTAFTAAQIPWIDGRNYPAELAGELYPNGIPIYDESELPRLIKAHQTEQVIFAYSDVTHNYVMHKASEVNALGADFRLISPDKTMLKSNKPVVSICAVRTGCGKSQSARYIINIIKSFGKKVTAVRHPMPYGDLLKQKAQRFETLQDLEDHHCTIEEMEEYEPHIEQGHVVFAGVDYEAVLRLAEQESDVIIWDGGNNDLPFYKPDIEIVIVDPHRPGHELLYYPGETNFRQAGVIIINKEDTATPEGINIVKENIAKYNPTAKVVDANSPITIENGFDLKGKKVLAIEDGPTLTHGEMTYGAGVLYAIQHGAELIDPKQWAVGTIADTYKKYPKIGPLLPAMGYSKQQIADLQATVNQIKADVYLIGTPIDLRRLIQFPGTAVRVKYELVEAGGANLREILRDGLGI